MTITDLHWAAGLIEGEGHFSCQNKGKHKKHPTYHIEVTMIDKEPLQKLQQFFGGKLSKRVKLKNRKQTYRWSLPRRANCIGIMRILQPLMSPRRQKQITKIFSIIIKHPTKRYGITQYE